MELEQRAVSVVERAEKEIAALMAEAAAQRDYTRTSMLLALAQRLRDAVRPLSIEAGKAGSDGSAERTGSALQDAGDRSIPSTPARSRGAYPRFKRDGGNLVKIGWSKSDRATYEHRSPQAVLQRVVLRLREVGGVGNRFTSEELMPLTDEHGEELPSYQVYLCLAWLISIGLVQRHGRQGYTVPSAVDLEGATDAAWSGLPSR